jgi:hypothetical protein
MHEQDTSTDYILNSAIEKKKYNLRKLKLLPFYYNFYLLGHC